MSTFGMKFKPATLVMALAAAFPVVAYAAAGRIDFAVGEVKALAPDGRAHPLVKGDEFNSGETIETGNGRAWLRFTDGAQVSLQPQSQYRIDNYNFTGKADGEEKGFFSLLKGGLRTITGLVGRTNRNNYNVNTAVATIGIRGTEYSITYGNSITVSTGEGEVEVCNSGGCLTLGSGETGYVADSNTKPVLTNQKADLPPPPPLPLPDFSVSNNTDMLGGGGSPSLLPSGPGYAMAWVSPTTVAIYDYGVESSGTATFGNSTTLTAFNNGSGNTYASGTFADVGSDGILGWGRWVSGNATFFSSYTGPMSNVAYVVGIPTPAADMSALASSSVIGYYSLIGATSPTSASGAVGSPGSVSGTLTANFSLASVDVSLSGSVGGQSFSVNVPSASISGSTFTGSNGPSNIIGFFAGAGASRAGLAYQTYNAIVGNISGGAAFSMTSTSTYCYSC
jgi:hypothetical protein